MGAQLPPRVACRNRGPSFLTTLQLALNCRLCYLANVNGVISFMDKNGFMSSKSVKFTILFAR